MTLMLQAYQAIFDTWEMFTCTVKYLNVLKVVVFKGEYLCQLVTYL